MKSKKRTLPVPNILDQPLKKEDVISPISSAELNNIHQKYGEAYIREIEDLVHKSDFLTDIIAPNDTAIKSELACYRPVNSYSVSFKRRDKLTEKQKEELVDGIVIEKQPNQYTEWRKKNKHLFSKKNSPNLMFRRDFDRQIGHYFIDSVDIYPATSKPVKRKKSQKIPKYNPKSIHSNSKSINQMYKRLNHPISHRPTKSGLVEIPIMKSHVQGGAIGSEMEKLDETTKPLFNEAERIDSQKNPENTVNTKTEIQMESNIEGNSSESPLRFEPNSGSYSHASSLKYDSIPVTLTNPIPIKLSSIEFVKEEPIVEVKMIELLKTKKSSNIENTNKVSKNSDDTSHAEKSEQGKENDLMEEKIQDDDCMNSESLKVDPKCSADLDAQKKADPLLTQSNDEEKIGREEPCSNVEPAPSLATDIGPEKKSHENIKLKRNKKIEYVKHSPFESPEGFDVNVKNTKKNSVNASKGPINSFVVDQSKSIKSKNSDLSTRSDCTKNTTSVLGSSGTRNHQKSQKDKNSIISSKNQQLKQVTPKDQIKHVTPRQNKSKLLNGFLVESHTSSESHEEEEHVKSHCAPLNKQRLVVSTPIGRNSDVTPLVSNSTFSSGIVPMDSNLFFKTPSKHNAYSASRSTKSRIGYVDDLPLNDHSENNASFSIQDDVEMLLKTSPVLKGDKCIIDDNTHNESRTFIESPYIMSRKGEAIKDGHIHDNSFVNECVKHAQGSSILNGNSNSESDSIFLNNSPFSKKGDHDVDAGACFQNMESDSPSRYISHFSSIASGSPNIQNNTGIVSGSPDGRQYNASIVNGSPWWQTSINNHVHDIRPDNKRPVLMKQCIDQKEAILKSNHKDDLKVHVDDHRIHNESEKVDCVATNQVNNNLDSCLRNAPMVSDSKGHQKVRGSMCNKHKHINEDTKINGSATRKHANYLCDQMLDRGTYDSNPHSKGYLTIELPVFSTTEEKSSDDTLDLNNIRCLPLHLFGSDTQSTTDQTELLPDDVYGNERSHFCSNVCKNGGTKDFIAKDSGSVNLVHKDHDIGQFDASIPDSSKSKIVQTGSVDVDSQQLQTEITKSVRFKVIDKQNNTIERTETVISNILSNRLDEKTETFYRDNTQSGIYRTELQPNDINFRDTRFSNTETRLPDEMFIEVVGSQVEENTETFVRDNTLEQRTVLFDVTGNINEHTETIFGVMEGEISAVEHNNGMIFDSKHSKVNTTDGKDIKQQKLVTRKGAHVSKVKSNKQFDFDDLFDDETHSNTVSETDQFDFREFLRILGRSTEEIDTSHSDSESKLDNTSLNHNNAMIQNTTIKSDESLLCKTMTNHNDGMILSSSLNDDGSLLYNTMTNHNYGMIQDTTLREDESKLDNTSLNHNNAMIQCSTDESDFINSNFPKSTGEYYVSGPNKFDLDSRFDRSAGFERKNHPHAMIGEENSQHLVSLNSLLDCHSAEASFVSSDNFKSFVAVYGENNTLNVDDLMSYTNSGCVSVPEKPEEKDMTIGDDCNGFVNAKVDRLTEMTPPDLSVNNTITYEQTEISPPVTHIKEKTELTSFSGSSSIEKTEMTPLSDQYINPLPIKTSVTSLLRVEDLNCSSDMQFYESPQFDNNEVTEISSISLEPSPVKYSDSEDHAFVDGQSCDVRSEDSIRMYMSPSDTDMNKQKMHYNVIYETPRIGYQSLSSTTFIDAAIEYDINSVGAMVGSGLRSSDTDFRCSKFPSSPPSINVIDLQQSCQNDEGYISKENDNNIEDSDNEIFKFDSGGDYDLGISGSPFKDNEYDESDDENEVLVNVQVVDDKELSMKRVSNTDASPVEHVLSDINKGFIESEEAPTVCKRDFTKPDEQKKNGFQKGTEDIADTCQSYSDNSSIRSLINFVCENKLQREAQSWTAESSVGIEESDIHSITNESLQDELSDNQGIVPMRKNTDDKSSDEINQSEINTVQEIIITDLQSNSQESIHSISLFPEIYIRRMASTPPKKVVEYGDFNYNEMVAHSYNTPIHTHRNKSSIFNFDMNTYSDPSLVNGDKFLEESISFINSISIQDQDAYTKEMESEQYQYLASGSPSMYGSFMQSKMSSDNLNSIEQVTVQEDVTEKPAPILRTPKKGNVTDDELVNKTETNVTFSVSPTVKALEERVETPIDGGSNSVIASKDMDNDTSVYNNKSSNSQSKETAVLVMMESSQSNENIIDCNGVDQSQEGYDNSSTTRASNSTKSKQHKPGAAMSGSEDYNNNSVLNELSGSSIGRKRSPNRPSVSLYSDDE